MEFMSRGRGNVQSAHPQSDSAGPSPVRASGRRKHIDWDGKVVRIEWFIFTLLLAVVLLLTIGWSIYGGNGVGYSESKLVDDKKYQAVFLNGGSTSGSVAYTTYFGHVTKLSDKYMVLQDVYYLTTDQGTDGQSSNPQLTKLGCQQLHSPYDRMVINRNQVAFWENLRDDGKVVEAIKEFVKQNPNGPNCSASTDSTGSQSQSTQSQSNSQSGATSPNTNSNNTAQ